MSDLAVASGALDRHEAAEFPSVVTGRGDGRSCVPRVRAVCPFRTFAVVASAVSTFGSRRPATAKRRTGLDPGTEPKHPTGGEPT